MAEIIINIEHDTIYKCPKCGDKIEMWQRWCRDCAELLEWTVKLESCPFCGGKAKINKERCRFFGYSGFQVVCENCKCSTKWFPRPDWAAMVWNSRGDFSEKIKNKAKEIKGIVSTASKNSPLSEEERREFITGLSTEQIYYLAMKMVDMNTDGSFGMFDMPTVFDIGIYVSSRLYDVGGFCYNFE